MTSLYRDPAELHTYFTNQTIAAEFHDITSEDITRLVSWVQRLYRLMYELPVSNECRFLHTPSTPKGGRMRDIAKSFHKPHYYGLTLKQSHQYRVSAMFSQRHRTSVNLLKRFCDARRHLNWGSLSPLEIDFDTMIANPKRPMLTVRYTDAVEKSFCFII